MEDECLWEVNVILIFSWSGSSNVGQIANFCPGLSRQGIGRYLWVSQIHRPWPEVKRRRSSW